MKKTLKKFTSWVALIGFSALVAFTVFEVVFRVMGYGSLILYQADPSLYWIPKPNQEAKTKIGGFPVHVNSHGTRGDDFKIPKPDGLYRILSIGDSRAFGWGLPQEKTYANLLEKKLGDMHPNLDVEVINAGVNAWSYPQLKIFLQEHGLNYQPDMVIVGDANLWMHFNESRGDEFRTAFNKRVVLKNLLRRSAMYHYIVESQFESFYKKHRGKLMPKVERDDEKQARSAKENPTEMYRQYITSIAKLVTDSGSTCVFLHIPQENHLTSINENAVKSFGAENIRTLKRQVAKNQKVDFVDIMPSFINLQAKLYLESDPVHPNEQGAAIIADQLAHVISPLISTE